MKFATPIGIFSIGLDGIKLGEDGFSWFSIILLAALVLFIRAWLIVIKLATDTTSVLLGIIGVELTLFWIYNLRVGNGEGK